MADGLTSVARLLPATFLPDGSKRHNRSQTDVSCGYIVNVERLLLENLSMIEGIVRQTCARRRFRDAVAEEFSSFVRLRIVENDYAILRKFEGRSQLRTYLITVVQRLALDFQIAQSGKWRPSSQAKRIGQMAVELETLLYRDHFTFEEACQTLLHKHPAYTRQQIEEIASSISPRESLRPQVIDLETVREDPRITAPEYSLPDEKQKVVRQLESAVQQIIRSLSDEDHLILRLKFGSNLTANEMAPLVNMVPKKLYRRIESIVQKIRSEMEKEKIIVGGIESSEMAKYVQFSFGERSDGKT